MKTSPGRAPMPPGARRPAANAVPPAAPPAAGRADNPAPPAPAAEGVPAPPTLLTITREIDARVCSLHRLAAQLHDRVETLRQEGPMIDLQLLESRAEYIAAMRHLYSELQGLLATVSRSGSAAEAQHSGDIRRAQEGLLRVQTRIAGPSAAGTAAAGPAAGTATGAAAAASKAPPWVRPAAAAAADPTAGDAATPAAPAAALPAAAIPAAAIPAAAIPAAAIPAAVPAVRLDPAVRHIRVAGDLAIEAIALPPDVITAGEVFARVAPGPIYYIPRWNHFAFRLGGCVFHANIGKIYRSSASPPKAGDHALEAPKRVKECHRAKCPGTGAAGGGKACSYYHNPADHPGSTDVRNYVSDSWLYTPAASPARYGTRRVGSVSTLEVDLKVVGAEEARRFVSQTAHDVLCSYILWKYVIAPQGQKDTT